MSAAPPFSLTTRYLQKSPVFLSVYYWPPKKLHLHYNHNMLHSLFARRATFPPEGHTFQTGPTQTIIIIMIMIIIIIIIVTTTTLIIITWGEPCPGCSVSVWGQPPLPGSVLPSRSTFGKIFWQIQKVKIEQGIGWHNIKEKSEVYWCWKVKAT